MYIILVLILGGQAPRSHRLPTQIEEKDNSMGKFNSIRLSLKVYGYGIVSLN